MKKKSLNKYSPECVRSSRFSEKVAYQMGTATSGGACIIECLYRKLHPEEVDEMNAKIEVINSKLDSGEILSDEDNEYIVNIASKFHQTIIDERRKDEIQDYIDKSGNIGTLDEADIYERFKQFFPDSYIRKELVNELVAVIVNLIEVEKEKHPNFTLDEIFFNKARERGLRPSDSITDNLSLLSMDILTLYYDSQLEENKEKGAVIPQEQENMYKLLKNNPTAWACLMYEARHLLFDATKIKIGDKVSFVKEYDDYESDEETDIDGTVHSAEEENPEHWQLKADTVSSFYSLTKEARQILYTVSEYGDLGLFGFPRIMDVMKLHQKLLELREAAHCETSAEFLDMLAELSPIHKKEVRDESGKVIKAIDSWKDDGKEENYWASILYDKLTHNSKVRTVFFNCYRRNRLNYCSYNKDWHEGNRAFYRNTNGLSINSIYNSYISNFMDIDNPDACIFDEHGNLISIRKWNAFADPLKNDEVWDEERGIYYDNIDVYRDTLIADDDDMNYLEHRKNLIDNVNSFLNLKMDEETKNRIISNEAEYAGFCRSLRKAASIEVKGFRGKAEASQRGEEGVNITSVLDIIRPENEPKVRSSFKALFKRVVRKLDKFSMKSPVETSYRYGSSTYMVYTIPNSLGDRFESLAKYANKGNEALKKYLEDEFFICPIYATKLGEDSYEIHNYWLKVMYEEACSKDKSVNNPDSFTYTILNSTTRALGFNDKEFRKFSEKDNFSLSLAEWLTAKKETQTADFKGFGSIPLFVTGDSNSTRFLRVPILSIEECKEQLKEIAFREFYRKKMFRQFQDWCEEEGYSLNDKSSGGLSTFGDTSSSDIFTYFDFYNNLSLEQRQELDDLYERSVKVSYGDSYSEEELDTFEEARAAAEEELKEKLSKYVEEEIEEGYSDLCQTLVKKGLASYKSEKDGKNEYVLNGKELYITELLGKDGRSLFGNSEDHQAKVDLILEFYLNQKVHLATQLQFLTVDPGFYTGTEDMQKRFKENIASGDVLDLTAVDPSNPNRLIDRKGRIQEVIYLTDIKLNMEEEDSDFFDILNSIGLTESQLKHYRGATLTDGQSYRSFSSYRKILVMRGLWTEDMEKVYQIIETSRQKYRDTHDKSIEGHRLSREDWEKIMSYGVVFQPIKPFYYGFERVYMIDNDTTMFLPVQLKYSEYPLIPELLPLKSVKEEGKEETFKESRLAALGYLLEDKGIDLAAFSTCVKVGGYGDIDIRGRNSYQDLKNAFEGKDNEGKEMFIEVEKDGRKELQKVGRAKIHMHDLRGYRIQSNIPEKFNHARAIGTQAKKHILGGLKDSNKRKNYSFFKRIFTQGKFLICKPTEKNKNKGIEVSLSDGEEEGIDSDGLIKMVSALGSVGFIKSLKQILDSFKNPEDVANYLRSMKASDQRAPKDVLSYYKRDVDGEFNMSPAEGVNAFDNMASLLSMLRKNVIKQRMAGGSAVQVSAYGYEDDLKVHIEDNNVIYAECAIPFDFSYTLTNEDGSETEVKLDYFEYVDFNTGMLLDENNKPVEPGEGKSKLEKEFPGILDMIAYRIPTEKDYSIIRLKAKRFFPKTCGGTIMVPTQFTVVAGFDFDIDKLYFLKKEFSYKIKEKGITLNYDDTDSSKNYAVWTDWYTNTKEGREMYPYLIEAAAQRLGIKEPEYEQIVLPDGTTEDSEVVAIPQGEEFEKLVQTVNVHLDKEGLALISYYPQALGLMNQNGIPAGKYPSSSREVFTKHIASERFKKKFIIPTYEYDESKDVFDNSQVAVNNLFLYLYLERLADKDTLKERLTPGGYYNLRKAKDIMLAIQYGSIEDLKGINSYADLKRLAKEKSPKPNYNPTNISTIAHYQTYNAEYDDMIGVAANISINLRLVALTEEFLLKKKENDELRHLRVGSMLTADDTEDTGCNVGKRFLNVHKEGNSEGFAPIQDTELNVTEYLSATVDAVKDALLEYFGVDLRNIQIVCLLAELGASPEDIGILFNQPVVREALIKMKESSYHMTMNEALDYSIKGICKDNKIINKLRKEAHNRRDTYLSLDNLCRSFNPNLSSSTEFYITQLAVIDFIKELENASSEMSDQVNVSKCTSTNSVQSTVGALQAVEQRALQFFSKFGGKGSNFKVTVKGANDRKTSHIIDPYARIDASNPRKFLLKFCASPYCMEQTAYSAIITFLDDIIGSLFPYRTSVFKGVSNSLAMLTPKEYLSAEVFDEYNKGFTLFVLEHGSSVFNVGDGTTTTIVGGDGNLYDLPFSPRYFYNTLFPTIFTYIVNENEKRHQKADAKGEELELERYSHIPIISALHREEYTDRKTKNTSISLLMENIGGLINVQKDDLIESWADMFCSKDPVLKDLAKHLFFYSYYKNGFDFARTSIMYLAPLVLKKSLVADNGESYRDFYSSIFHLEYTENEDGSPKYSSISYKAGPNGTLGSIIMNVKDFLKAFVMNTELYQFKKEMWYKDFQEPGIEPVYAKDGEGNIIREGNRDVITEFTISFSEKEFKSKSTSLTKFASAIYDIEDEEKRSIVGYLFTPCIVYNGHLYVCDVDLNDPESIRFNWVSGGNASITYYKMEPLLGKNDYDTPVLASTRSSNYLRYGSNNTEAMREALLKYQESVEDMEVQVKKQATTLLPAVDVNQTNLDNNQADGEEHAQLNKYLDILRQVQSLYDSVGFEEYDTETPSILDKIIAAVANQSYDDLVQAITALREGINDTSRYDYTDITVYTNGIDTILQSLRLKKDPQQDVNPISVLEQELKNILTDMLEDEKNNLSASSAMSLLDKNSVYNTLTTALVKLGEGDRKSAYKSLSVLWEGKSKLSDKMLTLRKVTNDWFKETKEKDEDVEAYINDGFEIYTEKNPPACGGK